MIVVDTNILAARNLASAQTSLAEQVDQIDHFWIVPPLWRYEFQNILAKTIWAKRLSIEKAEETWHHVKTLMSENEHEPSAEKVIELSARYRVTGYDANFIALAMELDIMCVTEDGELQEKFPSIAISMEDFIKQNRSHGQVREAPAKYRTHRKKSPVRRT